MRKPKYEFGNVGPNAKNDTESLLRQRCNVCDFCNGVDGRRQMFKDPEDITGGFICKVCRKPGGEMKDFEEEIWFKEAIDGYKNNVDGNKDYDEFVEDLITNLEKIEGR